MQESDTAREVRRADLQRRLVAALPDVEAAVRLVAQRQCLSRAECEELASEVKLALVDNDYAVLDRFQGRSSLRTYLVTVVHRVFLDQRRKHWGKWRPSAAARRQGPLAVRLEELLYRDRLPFDEAAETLRTRYGSSQSREALLALARRLPVRPDRRPASDVDLETLPAAETEDPQAQLESAMTVARAQPLIEDEIRRLPPRDRIILRLRFEDDLSVADIARILNLDQKRLYRCIDDILARFRRALEERGLGWAELARMIDRGQCHLRLPLVTGPEIEAAGPSDEAQA
jgi:RNA polymerase sigma factor (sigma-70 family)